ncbi:uncharacterized protein LOC133226928 isoform X2 [Bos javanicus]|uniref:uncharacterized protein LOC133226928 isoform X2 n=1 Tax=Bos javanicus TaxID=9906 RepID=UPI002AA94A94|nr:uncharacterized protein LOC133226928 isoform X2 [Bos javanicus]
MTSWVSRLLPRNGRSLATASENQRAEDRHRHQEAYGYFLPIQTRWQDNDQYGHVNNVVYYSYFDTIINQYLISAFFQEKQHSILCMSVFGPERVLRAVFKQLTHDHNLPLSPISRQPHSAFHCVSGLCVLRSENGLADVPHGGLHGDQSVHLPHTGQLSSDPRGRIGRGESGALQRALPPCSVPS